MSWKSKYGEVECLQSWEIGFKSALENEWISVEERLPTQNEYVLAFNGKDMCVCWADVSSYDYLFMFGMSHSQQFRGVTHWMPLPEPPKP